MKYYKVKHGDVYDRKTGHTTIKNELLTEKERKTMFPTLERATFCGPLEISKNKTFMSFGARFETKEFRNFVGTCKS